MSSRLHLMLPALSIVLIVAGTGTAQAANYIKIGDIRGEAADDKHQGWIELTTVSLSPGGTATAPRTSGASTSFSVAAPNQGTRGEFSITKRMDSSSPTLRQYCATGRHIPEVQLDMTRGSPATPQAYEEYKFTDVVITSCRAAGAGGDGPSETISFVYGTMKVDYTPQNPPGQKPTSAPSRAFGPSNQRKP